MSDLKISEFRSRAEQGLPVPELALIERRGRTLHRRRVATVAGALALVVLAGGGIATMAGDDTDASPAPAVTPSATPTGPRWDVGVRTAVDQGEDVLLPGISHVSYDGVDVRFDVPGRDWEWFQAGMGLRRSAATRDDYGAAVFFLRDPSARLRPCGDRLVQALGSDPDRLIANVTPLLNLAHASVLEGPQVVDAFGGTAVHLRLQTDGSCSEGGGLPGQLRGVVDDFFAEPGWGGKAALDVWHLVVPGVEPAPILVASWELDGTRRHHAEQQALLDSLRIGPS
ncbi:MAG: hypothetical protein ACTHKG_11530 [Nocardioides sp.]